jgi:predicted transcriptional regulator
MQVAITIRLPIEMKRELEKLARQSNIPMSELIRESLDNYLATYVIGIFI